MSTHHDDSRPLLPGGTQGSIYRSPDREGMLEPLWREEQANLDKVALERRRAGVCQILDEIVKHELNKREGEQAKKEVIEGWKTEVLRLMDDSLPHVNYKYHWASTLKKYLYGIKGKLEETSTLPVEQFRIRRILDDFHFIGSELNGFQTFQPNNPVHPHFPLLWSNPILYAIQHTQGFSVIDDGCYFQVLGVLFSLRNEGWRYRQNHTEFFRNWSAAKVLELMGLKLVRPHSFNLIVE
ncbi:hypothetical protein JCM5350_006447 [Sporobolomyces pararoseus]